MKSKPYNKIHNFKKKSDVACFTKYVIEERLSSSTIIDNNAKQMSKQFTN